MFYIISIVAFLVPTLVLAAAPKDFAAFVKIIIDIISLLIPVVFGLALLVFLWGISFLVLHAADVAKRDEGKKIMIWGVIALFVMVSIWGFVNLLTNTFF